MTPPEGSDPNRGWYQDHVTGQWISFQVPQPAMTAMPPLDREEPEEQQDTTPTPTPNAQPVPRRGPPMPRPVFQSSSSQIPPPPIVSTPAPSQHSALHPTTFSFNPTTATPRTRAPLGLELDSLFDPIPSSPSPELEDLTPLYSTAATATRKPLQKADKGKKRATDNGGSSIPPVSKKPKPAPSKEKASSKGKGKQAAKRASTPAPSHGGRQPGSQNYSDDDLRALLHIIASIRPIGGSMWARVEERFNIWARQNDHPTRTQKPLKTKFDQMARTPKPTGSAEIPPLIAQAQEIERSINASVHLRELDDDNEIADNTRESEPDIEEVEEGGDDDEEAVPAKKKPVSGPVLKTFRDLGTGGTSRTSTTSRRSQVNEFMSAVTTSLDPAHREAREEARFARRATQDELGRLTQDNRDLRNRYDSLSERYHQQSFAYQQAMGELSRMQSRLDVLEMVGAFTGGHSAPRSVPPTPRARHTAHWDYDPASRPYASPYPSRTQSFHPSPRTPSRSHPDYLGGHVERQPARWENDDMDFGMSTGTSSYDDHAFVPHRELSPPVAGPSFSSSLPSTSSTLSGRFAAATSATGGLDALASAASSSHAHSRTSPVDSTSITMTFTPSRRYRRQASSPSNKD